MKNRPALVALMLPVTRTRTTLEWTQLQEDKAVPCDPINDMAQAFADPQVQARGLVLKTACSPYNTWASSC